MITRKMHKKNLFMRFCAVPVREEGSPWLAPTDESRRRCYRCTGARLTATSRRLDPELTFNSLGTFARARRAAWDPFHAL